MTTELKITGLDVLRVSPVGTTLFDYDKDSKMAGQKFRRYKFNGKAFAVNVSETQFIEAQSAGKLHQVNVEVNEAGQLSFVDCITAEQYKNFRSAQVEDAKTEGQMNYYKTAKFVPSAINAVEELPA